jgi:glucosyl-3-phosphoglycerate phosphatase
MTTHAPIQLFLARHGRTAWNVQRRFQGRTDVPLDDVGRAQARELATALRGRFQAVLASDLSRASETAQIVATALDLPLLGLDADLQERGYGKFEGLTGEECAAQYPEIWNATRGDRNFLPPGGEPFADVIVRVERGLSRCVERLRDRYQSALVVSHGSSLRMFLEHITGKPHASLNNLEYREVVYDGTRFAAVGSTEAAALP